LPSVGLSISASVGLSVPASVKLSVPAWTALDVTTVCASIIAGANNRSNRQAHRSVFQQKFMS
ncbi:MAG: hypothetical protein J6P82_05985, partial [Bacteroidales bacterium]|nr:hypothetical protein [Bacteroidales bacterium]